jgi:hypothetical protein
MWPATTWRWACCCWSPSCGMAGRPGRGLVVLAVSAGSHAIIDRRWPVRALLRATGSPGFARVEWGVLAVDQSLHLCVLALLAVLLA